LRAMSLLMRLRACCDRLLVSRSFVLLALYPFINFLSSPVPLILLQHNTMTEQPARIPREMKSFGDLWGPDEDYAYGTLTLNQDNANNTVAGANPYDPFTPTSLAAAVVGNHHQSQLNPYAQDATAMSGMGGYYQGQGNYTQPVRATKRFVLNSREVTRLYSFSTTSMRL